MADARFYFLSSLFYALLSSCRYNYWTVFESRPYNREGMLSHDGDNIEIKA